MSNDLGNVLVLLAFVVVFLLINLKAGTQTAKALSYWCMWLFLAAASIAAFRLVFLGVL